MDNGEFTRVAPIYYVLAILQTCRNRVSCSTADVTEIYRIEGTPDDPETWYYVDQATLFEAATIWIKEQEILDVVEDPFGPIIYVTRDDTAQKCQELEERGPKPFKNFAMARRSETWLSQALMGVERTFNQMRIQPSDFYAPENEWQPIPLDYDTSEELQAVVSNVEAVTEAVRGSNGFAVTARDEREFIIDSLTVLSSRLRTSRDVSPGYLRRFGIDSLNRLINRFGKAAVGAAAFTAREALLAYVRLKAPEVISWLLKP